MRLPCAVFVSMLVVAGAGCADRNPGNPLDPNNPNTGGEPRWLVAMADSAAVDLRWSVPAFTDVSAVQLWDALGDTVLWSGDVGAGSFRHDNLPDGVLQRYRLELNLTTGGERVLPEESATPGTTVPWVLDFLSEEIVRLTPDGTRTRFSRRIPGISGIAGDRETNGVLVANFFLGYVELLDGSGSSLWKREMFRPLTAVQVENSFWVIDPGDSLAVRLDRRGREAANVKFSGQLVGLAPGIGDEAWVASSDRVYRVGAGGEVAPANTPASPQLLAAAADGGVWVYLEDSSLLRLGAGGELLTSVAVSGAVRRLSPDPRAGVWLVQPGRIVKLSEDGSQDLVLETPSPRDVAVPADPRHDLWIADAIENAVLRVDFDGAEQARSLGLGFPARLQVLFASGLPLPPGP